MKLFVYAPSMLYELPRRAELIPRGSERFLRSRCMGLILHSFSWPLTPGVKPRSDTAWLFFIDGKLRGKGTGAKACAGRCLRSSRWLSPQPPLRTNQDRYVIDRTHRAAHFDRSGNSGPPRRRAAHRRPSVRLDGEPAGFKGGSTSRWSASARFEAHPAPRGCSVGLRGPWIGSGRRLAHSTLTAS